MPLLFSRSTYVHHVGNVTTGELDSNHMCMPKTQKRLDLIVAISNRLLFPLPHAFPTNQERVTVAQVAK